MVAETHFVIKIFRNHMNNDLLLNPPCVGYSALEIALCWLRFGFLEIIGIQEAYVQCKIVIIGDYYYWVLGVPTSTETTYSAFWKYSDHLTFSAFCYSLILKLTPKKDPSSIYTQYPIMTSKKQAFRYFFTFLKNKNWNITFRNSMSQGFGPIYSFMFLFLFVFLTIFYIVE